jgi:5-methylthioadenosine/S-adenosylhomocysteine deaminase
MSANSSTPQQVDLLIHARWLIPVTEPGLVLESHSVAIKDQRIVAVRESQQARAEFHALEEVQLGEHALIPGLVNTHGHSAMTLMRGIADDTPLKEWLEQHVWPLEAQFVAREYVYQGASLAIAEMLASGTTTFADMYFFPDEVGRAATDARMRVQLASPVLDFPTVWASNADEYIDKATQLHDDFRNSELVSMAFGPHAPYTVSDAPLNKIITLAEELDVPVHMHVHETAQEVADAISADGRRPLQRLAALGVISPRLVCVHATQLLPEEMQQLAELGASVVHCPESNLKLASGFCEVAKLMEHQVNVALGTDGCASNNDLDMFGEMRSAALLAKAVAGDASALPAYQALEMATINGARAMGMDTDIGSIEAGKLADLTAVSLDNINSWPLHNPVSQLVYSSHATQVSHVWVGGRLVVQDGDLRTLDKALLKQQSGEWQQAMSGR